MGLCPFHGEKSPSFSVSPSKQFFHCFGCNKSGNAIVFLMEHAGMGFVEAVHDLAQQTGLQVPDDDVSPQERERLAMQRQRQVTLSDVLAKAGKAWRGQLRDSPYAIKYLKDRGVSGPIARDYGLGYAPEGWHGLASVFADYNDPLLAESGLVVAYEEDGKRHDRFRDRIMFPIRNTKGECIGFGGRVLGDEKPKYLNSPETPVFHKGRELYGLFEGRSAIREHGFALVTEGYMDVVALAQLGFANTVATLGTACTPEHIAKLFRFTDAVIFSFDGDVAGQRAARKALDAALPHATDTRNIKFLFLPPEHDPDSFIRTHGHNAFARLIGNAMPLSRFLIAAASERCDVNTPEGRAYMASNARTLWTPLPDGALKRQLLTELTTLAQLGPNDLIELWNQAAEREAPRPPLLNNEVNNKNINNNIINNNNNINGIKVNFDENINENNTQETTPPTSARYQGVAHRNGYHQRPSNYRHNPPAPPIHRADHAARLLLSHMDFLDGLSHEDQATLCAMDAPYGALFGWIEGQFYEHGPQPWAVLRESLHGHDCEALASRLMTGSHAQTEGSIEELREELRGLLNRMLAEQLRVQERKAMDAVDATPGDQAALQRYRSLQLRRVALEQIGTGRASKEFGTITP